MAKFITEKTLRNIQIMHANTRHLRNRVLWIELACKISISFDIYCQMKNSAEMLNVSYEVTPIEEWEEIFMYVNKFLGTEFGLSDLYVDPDKSANEAIIYYQNYKNIMKIMEGGIFKATVAEKLYEEMYNDMRGFLTLTLMNHYYSKVAEQVLSYMCESIDYNAFKQNVLAINIVPNQRSIDGAMLKDMIRTSEKFVARYLKILKSQATEGKIGS